MMHKDLNAKIASSVIDSGRLFPNQFVLSPLYLDGLPDWQKIDVSEHIKLMAHPGLGVTRAHDGQSSLTLLGYMLDPLQPAASDETILRSMLEHYTSLANLIAASERYGGRWLIIAGRGDQLAMFGDALGLRQVFYTPNHNDNGVWAASQPGMLAECLGLVMSDEANEFIHSPDFRCHREYPWPATATPYAALKHLQPNHSLDLISGEAHRYWPDRSLAPVSFDEAIDTLVQTLPALIEAASLRFDLAVGMTAGWDSRLVLAASRAVSHKLSYITVQQAAMVDSAEDIRIPARVLTTLGLSHHVIKAATYTSPEFAYVFKRSVCLAHDHYAADAEAVYRYCGRRKVAITGSGAEVGRCSHRSQLGFTDHDRITAHDLARLEKIQNSAFAVRQFEAWMHDLGERHGIPLLDLHEWEQGHGNWLAMTQLEFDSGWQDIFTPYNCRRVLTTMLALDERYRCKPDYLLFRETIRRLWPEALSEAINPLPALTLKRRLRDVLARVFKPRRALPGLSG